MMYTNTSPVPRRCARTYTYLSWLTKPLIEPIAIFLFRHRSCRNVRWMYVSFLADLTNILTCATTGLRRANRLRTVYPLSLDAKAQTHGPYLHFQNPECWPKHSLKSGPPHRRSLLIESNVRLMSRDCPRDLEESSPFWKVCLSGGSVMKLCFKNQAFWTLFGILLGHRLIHRTIRWKKQYYFKKRAVFLSESARFWECERFF